MRLCVGEERDTVKRLICKMHHEWGERVCVSGQILTIPKDTGTLEVDDEIAAKLLQNKDMWDDEATAPKRIPGKRPMSFAEANPGVPNVEIRDPKTGRILDDDEALRLLGKPSRTQENKSADPIAAQAAELAAKPAPKAEEPPSPAVKAEEPPSDDWPEVTMDDSKETLLGVLKSLEKAGRNVDLGPKGTKSKASCFEQIEREYDAMSSEG
jgi:hypothetical protein